jgi:hypothetical protein
MTGKENRREPVPEGKILYFRKNDKRESIDGSVEKGTAQCGKTSSGKIGEPWGPGAAGALFFFSPLLFFAGKDARLLGPGVYLYAVFDLFPVQVDL